uniref:Uncharacterized protein n=1 Tax=Megaselia scalaris TaxID=36166 RepID=T1GEL6_MEGSC
MAEHDKNLRSKANKNNPVITAGTGLPRTPLTRPRVSRGGASSRGAKTTNNTRLIDSTGKDSNKTLTLTNLASPPVITAPTPQPPKSTGTIPKNTANVFDNNSNAASRIQEA